jgi:hypothetical protein
LEARARAGGEEEEEGRALLAACRRDLVSRLNLQWTAGCLPFSQSFHIPSFLVVTPLPSDARGSLSPLASDGSPPRLTLATLCGLLRDPVAFACRVLAHDAKPLGRSPATGVLPFALASFPSSSSSQS